MKTKTKAFILPVDGAERANIMQTLVLTAILFVCVLTVAQQSPVPLSITTATEATEYVHVVEPAVVHVEALFQAAQTVALVKIISGDSENYDGDVYKAIVLESYKGVPAQETIYFGPFAGGRLGSESIVFVRPSNTLMIPKTKSNAGYGTISYYRVFNEGGGDMPTSYECVFDGKDPVQRCDQAVQICTGYILLPRSIVVYPRKDDAYRCKWARQSIFISLLQRLGACSRD